MVRPAWVNADHRDPGGVAGGVPARWSASGSRSIERRRDIGLIERPECKRRWQTEPWEKKERAALRTWLLDRCEDRDSGTSPIDQGNRAAAADDGEPAGGPVAR